MYSIVGGILSIPLVWFLYFHCARPMLANRGARPVAFMVTAVAGVVLIGLLVLGGVFATLVIVSDRELSFREFAPLINFGSLLALAPFVAAILAPGPTTRLSGGPDEDIRRRYVLDFFGGTWQGAVGDAANERRAVESLVGWMREAGQEEWLMRPGGPVRQFLRPEVPSDVRAGRAAITELLATNRPFDPLSWLRHRKWAARALAAGRPIAV